MPQLRSSNRSAVVDNCQGHELTVIPKTRKPAENCPEHTRRKINVLDANAELRHTGKTVSRAQNADNIRKYKQARERVVEAKRLLMEHLLTCETCIQ